MVAPNCSVNQAIVHAVVALLLGVNLVLPAASQMPTSRPGITGLTLRGTVSREDGSPLAEATAYVYTAAVRRGTSPY